MGSDAIVTAFVTLLVTVDPIGLLPLFLALTADATAAVRRRIAVRAVLIATIVMLVFLFVGGELLSLLGISLPAFRIAGGLMLFFIAFEMVFDRRQRRKSEAAGRAHTEDHDDLMEIAVFPLAIPLTAGPGAISAAILLATEAPDLVSRAILAGLVVATMALTLLAFFAAEGLDRIMPETVRNVSTRLLGVLLAALSVQFVIDGIAEVVGVGMGAWSESG